MASDDTLDLSPDIQEIAQECLAEERSSTSHSAVEDGLSMWSNYIPSARPISTKTISPQWGRTAPSVSKPTWGRIASAPKHAPSPSVKPHTTGYEGVPNDDMFGSNIEDTFLKLLKSNPNHALGRNEG